MMAQKHLLQELLKEDQEPFLLKNHISDRLSQLKIRSNNVSKTNSISLHLQVKKQQNSSFPINLCKNACFLSIHNTSTSDLRKSPLFEFASPAKSPCRSPNTIFLHIPSRTAAILLESASKIQKQSKTKTQNKSNRFGLYLGSLFKKLRKGSRNKKREIEGTNSNYVKVKDLLRFHSSNKICYDKGIKDVVVTGVCSCEVGFACSCNVRPRSSAVWSESNEDNKSLNMETLSTSGQSYDYVEDKENTDCVCFDDKKNGALFCESPFRLALDQNPSAFSGRRTPEFSSPLSSPSRRRTEDKDSNGAVRLNKFQSSEEEEEEEEEKEQCSPVSVLDPSFEDDEDAHENNDEEDGFDLECSYANVQRAKQQLLYKLCKFEQLAQLDPLELEKRMLDQEEYDYETFIEDDECEDDDFQTSCEDDDFQTSCEEKELRELVFEILYHPSVHDRRHVPQDLRRLVSDLIMEEEREIDSSEDRNMVIRRVCRRLELWKEVESNTIDMMIEEEFSREECGWKKNAVQIRDLVGEFELDIFGFLAEEFSEALLCSKREV